jgi:hypothetical protein
MTRKRPLCAECGKPLANDKYHQGFVSIRYHVPGRPEIGWHWEICASADMMAKVAMNGPEQVGMGTLVGMVKAIRKRGRGRVVIGSRRAFDRWMRQMARKNDKTGF